MPSFELIDRKSPVNLVPGNHIIVNGDFWRVIENYRLLGHPEAGRRMLVIVHHTHLNPVGYKFHEIEDHKIDAYNRKD